MTVPLDFLLLTRMLLAVIKDANPQDGYSLRLVRLELTSFKPGHAMGWEKAYARGPPVDRCSALEECGDPPGSLGRATRRQGRGSHA
jgi:hypothetical protein